MIRRNLLAPASRTSPRAEEGIAMRPAAPCTLALALALAAARPAVLSGQEASLSTLLTEAEVANPRSPLPGERPTPRPPGCLRRGLCPTPRSVSAS
jgi:hypothetical protein